MTEKIADVSSEAVADATGRGWDAWLAELDDRGGREMDHKELVSSLADAGVESGWWQQKIAVGYEKERGMREKGETADSGYQVGVQRTIGVPRGDLWDFLTSADGLAVWLGDGANPAIESKTEYETADGTTGEIRTTKDGERIRLTWQPAERKAATTLQLMLRTPDSGDDRTRLRFHHEKLADADERETMRDHWTAVLDRIEEAATPADDG